MATTTTTKLKTYVGERIRRVEDPRLITGRATYVDDIQKPGMLYTSVLRSPYPAAKIKSIDTKGASALPGVKAVYIGKDVASVGPVPCAGSMPTLRVPKHTILATDPPKPQNPLDVFLNLINFHFFVIIIFKEN
jgi:carbon-monoxide dehydrogenase large subunit